MEHPQKSLKPVVNRRDFLRSAVMGIAVAPFLPAILTNQSQPETIDVTGGTLTAMGDKWIEIGAGEQLRRFSIDSHTSIWKGGEVSPSILLKGDDIMVRFLTGQNLALRIWSNLTRIDATVAQVTKNGYILKTGGPHTAERELLLAVNENTQFGTMGGNFLAPAKLAVGEFVDAIGEKIPEGVRGTLLFAEKNQPKGSVKPGPNKIEQLPNGLCTYHYLGYAGWFNCATGAGRCGCNTANNNECAWPAMDTCGCCSPSCCDCSKGCKNQVYLACNYIVYVLDYCHNTNRAIKIKDCGPCQVANCNQCQSGTLCPRTCGDCRGLTSPVVDLTRPTFAAFGYDPATRGCFSCDASVTVVC